MGNFFNVKNTRNVITVSVKSVTRHSVKTDMLLVIGSLQTSKEYR